MKLNYFIYLPSFPILEVTIKNLNDKIKEYEERMDGTIQVFQVTP